MHMYAVIPNQLNSQIGASIIQVYVFQTYKEMDVTKRQRGE